MPRFVFELPQAKEPFVKVYIAGASSEIERAVKWRDKLREVGVDVVSTWPDVIKAIGVANPTDASVDEYKQWTWKDLDQVRDADVLWVLLPEANTVGAWIELGFMTCLRAMPSMLREQAGIDDGNDRQIFMSGRHRPIFTPALADYHSLDDQGVFEYICKLATS